MDDLRKKLYDDLLKKAKEKQSRAQEDLAATPDITAEEAGGAARQRALNAGLLQASNMVGGVKNDQYDQYAERMGSADTSGLKARQQATGALDEAQAEYGKQGLAVADLNKKIELENAPVDEETRTAVNTTLKNLGYNTLRAPAGMTRKMLEEHPVFGKIAQDLPGHQEKYLAREATAANLKETRLDRQSREAEARRVREETRLANIAENDRIRKEKREQQISDRLSTLQSDVEKKEVDFDMRKTNLDESVNRLKQLINDKGTVAVFGPEGSEMDSIAYDLAIDYAKLVDPTSVAREGEVKAAQKYLIPIRESFMGVKGAGVRNSTAIETLNRFQSMIDRRAAERKKAIRQPIAGMQSRMGQPSDGGLNLQDPTAAPTSGARREWTP
jgi:hypothetical protein